MEVCEDLSYAVGKDQVQFQSDFECINGKDSAYQVLDIMLLRKDRLQKTRTLSLSTKSWKFKYKEMKFLGLHEKSQVYSAFYQKAGTELESYDICCEFNTLRWLASNHCLEVKGLEMSDHCGFEQKAGFELEMYGWESQKRRTFQSLTMKMQAHRDSFGSYSWVSVLGKRKLCKNWWFKYKKSIMAGAFQRNVRRQRARKQRELK